MKTLRPQRKVFYVYALCDPTKPGDFWYGRSHLSFEPFYIGKGKGERSKFHLRVAISSIHSQHKYNSHKLNKIRKLYQNGHELVVVHSAFMTENQALKKEIDLIRIIGRRIDESGPLTNLTLGGDGVSGLVFSENSRKVMSESQRARFKAADASDMVIREERRLATRARTEVAARIGKAISLGHANRSAAEKTKTAARQSVEWHQRTPEQRAERERKRRATLDSRTDVEKAQTILRHWETRRSYGPEHEADIQRRRQETLKKRDPEIIAEHRRKTSEASKRYWSERRAALAPMKIQNKIRRLYSTGNYTQINLAAKFGLTQSFVSRIVTDGFK